MAEEPSPVTPRRGGPASKPKGELQGSSTDRAVVSEFSSGTWETIPTLWVSISTVVFAGMVSLPWARAILDVAPSYAEVSPSGRGLKLFFYVASEDVRRFLDRIGAQPHQWGVRRDVPGEDSGNHGPAIEVYSRTAISP